MTADAVFYVVVALAAVLAFVCGLLRGGKR